jgi:hypothetical protein
MNINIGEIDQKVQLTIEQANAKLNQLGGPKERTQRTNTCRCITVCSKRVAEAEVLDVLQNAMEAEDETFTVKCVKNECQRCFYFKIFNVKAVIYRKYF